MVVGKIRSNILWFAVKGISACNGNHMCVRLSFSFSSFEGKYHLVIMQMREGRRRRALPCWGISARAGLGWLGIPPTFHNERFMSGAFGTTLLGYCESVRVQ